MAEFTVTIFFKDGAQIEWPGFEHRFEFQALDEARELLKAEGMLDEVASLRADYVKQPSTPMTMRDLDVQLGLERPNLFTSLLAESVR